MHISQVMTYFTTKKAHLSRKPREQRQPPKASNLPTLSSASCDRWVGGAPAKPARPRSPGYDSLFNSRVEKQGRTKNNVAASEGLQVASRAQQVAALEQAACTLFGRAKNDAQKLPDQPQLFSLNFEEDLKPKAQLLSALFELKVSNYAAAIYHLDELLDESPSDRNALVYRWVAGMQETRNISISKRMQVNADIVNHLTCVPNDLFGRLIYIAAARTLCPEEETLAALYRVADDFPESSLAWSMVAAQLFRLALLCGQHHRLSDASVLARKALQFDGTNLLALSALWHSTNGTGFALYPDQMGGIYEPEEATKRVYERTKTEPRAISNIQLFGDDPIVSKSFEFKTHSIA